MKIVVDADRMHSGSGGIRTLSTELERNMEEIEILVTSLNDFWKGEAEKAYVSRLIYIKREFVEFLRFFDEYAMNLNRFADDYQSHEEELAAQITGV